MNSNEMSGQEKRALKGEIDAEERFHQEFENFLITLSDHPAMFTAPRLRYLREFCSKVERFPLVYQSQDGDETISMPTPSANTEAKLTKGYVKSLASLDSNRETTD